MLCGCATYSKNPGMRYDPGFDTQKLVTLYQSQKGSLALVEKVDDVGNCDSLTCPLVTKVMPGVRKIQFYCNLGLDQSHPIITANFKAGHYYEISCSRAGFKATVTATDMGTNIDIEDVVRKCNGIWCPAEG